MKYIKFSIYFIITITFFYLIMNLNKSIELVSYTLVSFFNTLFPYLLIFLIINQLLIKTKIIYFISSLLEPILYKFFKINSKEISLILISILNGFPSSMIYGEIMIKEKDLTYNQVKRIAPIFFIPSITFIFYIIKAQLLPLHFYVLIISLYTPLLIILFLSKKESNSKYIGKSIVNEIKNSFSNFNYILVLKEIIINSFQNIINILGMITFYSLITIMIPFPFIKGLFEFSMPTLEILNSQYSTLIKTFLILIILVFSSFSSLSQASMYMETTKIKFKYFIKKRITMLFLSLLIFNLILFLYPL